MFKFDTSVKYNVETGMVEMSLEYYELMKSEIKRLNEAYQQAKSEAFQLQRELWNSN